MAIRISRRQTLPRKIAAAALSLAVVGAAVAAEAVGRVRVEGSPYYLEEAAAKVKNDIATFTLYTPAAASDAGTDIVLNCNSRELAAKTGEQWSVPYRILPGEALYPVGKKLCDWDAKSIFQRFSF